MKILTVDKIREADAYTIANEPIASIDLMERAGGNCADHIYYNTIWETSFYIIAGPGNNGGDGLVIARHLKKTFGIKKVMVFVIDFTTNYSEDFRINLKRCEETEGVDIKHITDAGQIEFPEDNFIIIDAVFGSGLNRPVKGLPADVIHKINTAKCEKVYSIDIPSGMFADKITTEKEGAIVRADEPLSLEFPKLTMFTPENSPYTGRLEVISIGLHPDYISKVKPAAVLLEKSIVAGLLKRRRKFDHKGNFGHALLIAGSSDKTGAAILASESCLRSGAGLLTTRLPKKAAHALPVAIPEAMLSIDDDDEVFSSLPDLSKYNAVAIGPGLGTSPKTAAGLKLLIQQYQNPIVFDADALNILAENKTWLSFIPAESIFTPHFKEFERLAGKSSDHIQRIEKQKAMSIKYGIYIILKGAHSVISCPDGTLYINDTGNPGMATGGSGDVLTGIVLGLLAQGYSPHDASITATYLHGLAGDLAARKSGFEALLASDITAKIGKAYKKLRQTENKYF
jgi:NAD(P)H-hydrate epimerase